MLRLSLSHRLCHRLTPFAQRCYSSVLSTIEEKAAHKMLKDTDLAYIVPLYIENDGGHDRKVAKWFKQEGDPVASQDVLCEIDTTEFSYDFTTEEEGFLAQCVAVEDSGVVEDAELLALLVPTVEDLEHFRARFVEVCRALENDQQSTSEPQPDETVQATVQRVLRTTGMEQYTEVFHTLVEEEGFDTPCTLREITEDDLIEAGVTKKGHRRALLRGFSPVQEEK